MSGSLHVSLGRSCARIEILEDQNFGHVRTPFEKPTMDSFEESRYRGTAQGLMCKFDSFTRVCTECVKVAIVTVGVAYADDTAMCGARSKQGPGRGRTLCPGVVRTFLPMGKVHKSMECIKPFFPD